MEQLIVTEKAWPHGLRCMECNTKLEEGTAYSKRLIGITSPTDEDESSEFGYPIVEIVCVPCGLGLTSGR
jgi:hypothetical protein